MKKTVKRHKKFCHFFCGYSKSAGYEKTPLHCQKKEEPSVCWEDQFCNVFFNLNHLPATKKDCKNQASQGTLGSAFFSHGFNMLTIFRG